jgi:hypothetical protein
MDLLFEMVLHEVFIVGCVVGFLGGITVGAVYVAWDSRIKK